MDSNNLSYKLSPYKRQAGSHGRDGAKDPSAAELLIFCQK